MWFLRIGRIAVREMAQEQSIDLRQNARIPQMDQHAIGAVGFFADLFDCENGVAIRRAEWSGQIGNDQGQVPAEQWTFGPSSDSFHSGFLFRLRKFAWFFR